MQIDFHHTVTYVVARIAGFDHQRAHTIAYAAQYVDDATNAGAITFKNRAMYYRIASAHKMIDYDNFVALANHQVWIPFHFLPGNDGLAKGQNPDKSFIHKIICRPDSPVAQDMLKACLDDRDKPYALHRLGITLHVYADTWAHQGFAGVNHEVNQVSKLVLENGTKRRHHLARKIKKFLFYRLQRLLKTFPLGHGPAMDCPDRPYLKWSYINGLGESVQRDNTEIFLEAVQKMFSFLRHYKEALGETPVEHFPSKDLERIRHCFENFKEDEGEVRHQKWLKLIETGSFTFGAQKLEYVAKGKGSWKYDILKTEKTSDSLWDRFDYSPAFLTSDWKLFHDALQAHRFELLHDILPAYGISAA